MTARPQSARAGELLGGKYRLVRFLAEGGMGVVYEAQHVVVRRRFAVKLLRADLADRRDILSRFQREAEAAGALESEHVAAAVDFGIADGGAPFIVMEYLVGESLASLLEREGKLPVARAADLCLQASRGIQAAHDAGIVHRDLKPQNLFVCRREDGSDLVKVLDFGVAKLQAAADTTAATQTGTVLGTVSYMAPEQARGDKSIDHRADIYALGAILYELVSGQKPHTGSSPNAVLHHISTQPAAPLASVQAGLPAPLVELVERALASAPEARPQTAAAFGQAMASFARRDVWPAGRPDDSGRVRGEVSSTLLAPGTPPRPRPSDDSSLVAAATVDARPAPPPQRRRARGLIVFGAAGLAVAALAAGVAQREKSAATMKASGARLHRTLPPSTAFFAPAARAPATQQIAALANAGALADAAILTAMAATPRGEWFVGGSPTDVEDGVRQIVVRAAREHQIAVLVAYNLPYRDCAQYSAGGARDGAAYAAWIEGFAAGIGNEKAVVALEPDSLGIIPHNVALSGEAEWCKPTVSDDRGKVVPAPEASPAHCYAQLRAALATFHAKAPNAWVYLDGTHSDWLSVGEIASRLQEAGIDDAQGFFLNVANNQPTPALIRYGTRVSKCLYYVRNQADAGPGRGQYAACASPRRPAPGVDVDAATWARADKWYEDNVDRAPHPPSGPSALAHFIIDTGRNGRGTLDVSRYAGPPYHQPASVIATLAAGKWCNPPGAGHGLRPTATTGEPLVDAFLWIKVPGESDGSCDIAGGSRAWSYANYNPWRIAGDAQRHFDPLWGMVDPPAGMWFTNQALDLARNASPPLDGVSVQDVARPPTVAEPAPGQNRTSSRRRP